MLLIILAFGAQKWETISEEEKKNRTQREHVRSRINRERKWNRFDFEWEPFQPNTDYGKSHTQVQIKNL